MKPVLYVEDEAVEIFLMQRAFEQAGMEKLLQVATGGDEAIAYLSGTGQFADRFAYPMPQLVLLDLNMPRISGFVVLEWIRRNPEIAELPVLVFTSSDQKTDMNRAASMGANGYLVKPVKLEWLVDVVKNIRDTWLTPGARKPMVKRATSKP